MARSHEDFVDMYMDKVNSYFKYATGISNIQTATNEEIKTIDGFYFDSNNDFLMIKSVRVRIHTRKRQNIFL